MNRLVCIYHDTLCFTIIQLLLLVIITSNKLFISKFNPNNLIFAKAKDAFQDLTRVFCETDSQYNHKIFLQDFSEAFAPEI